MVAGIVNLIDYLLFIFARLNWLSVVDILLVTVVFFVILLLLRDTQAIVLLRGALLLIALVGVLTSLEVLPAFSWLMRNTLPGIVFAIPVIFAPEIRRALERLGRTGRFLPTEKTQSNMVQTVDTLISAVSRLSHRKHGALIVLQRLDNLKEFINTGVMMEAHVTPELLLQIFYPNTPLHDGAVIISGKRVVAASCVIPLSTSDS
ncbi:MAG TPA: TIGR00159 family protein, partial [Anaerolineae bacterium]|nr:TIGR00159 family protein [Anaerolineae bacterium]